MRTTSALRGELQGWIRQAWPRLRTPERAEGTARVRWYGVFVTPPMPRAWPIDGSARALYHAFAIGAPGSSTQPRDIAAVPGFDINTWVDSPPWFEVSHPFASFEVDARERTLSSATLREVLALAGRCNPGGPPPSRSPAGYGTTDDEETLLELFARERAPEVLPELVSAQDWMVALCWKYPTLPRALRADHGAYLAWCRWNVPPPPAENAVLHARVGTGEWVAVTRDVVIGRSPESDIVVADPRVSRTHGAVRFRDGAPWVLDLGSTSGIFVNDEACASALLLHGDRVRFGGVVVEFRYLRA